MVPLCSHWNCRWLEKILTKYAEYSFIIMICLTLNFVQNLWYTGGRLKTTAEADGESLQAKWVPVVGDLNLRAKDILPLVDKGSCIHDRQTIL